MLDLQTPYGLGCYGELIGNRLLKGSELVRQKGYDILWGNKKVEVKTSSPVACGGWSFYFPKTQLKVATDWLLILLDEDKDVYKILFIPKDDLKVRGLVITSNKLVNYLRYEIS